MEDHLRLKALQTQRESIKGQLHMFQSFLNNYNPETDFIQLQIRLQRIKSIFEKFDSVHDELDILDGSETSLNDRFSIWEDYYKQISIAHQHTPITQTQTNAYPNLQSTSHVIQHNSLEGDGNSSFHNLKRRIKLPQASIPTFDGKLEHWLSFKNSFNSLIHECSDLSDVEKLHYLRSALCGDALKKIQVLTINEANYSNAWNILQRAYENKRILISRHLSLLLNLPHQEKNDSKILETLADEAQQHMQSLSSLGINLSPEIVVQIIEERLNRFTRMKWEETLTRDEFPTFEKLTEFLYKTATSLSKQNAHNDNGPPSKIRKKETAKTFVTSGKKCPSCLENFHPLFKCYKFRELSIPQRIALVKENGLCKNCLRIHKNQECKFGNCKTCNERHNTLLHFCKTPGNDSSVKANNNEDKIPA